MLYLWRRMGEEEIRGSGVLVAAVRMVQRADDVRQLLRRRVVGGEDDVPRE